MSQKIVEILGQGFERKKLKNSQYSLRALARHLNCSPSLVHHYFNGRRRLNVEWAQKLSEVLELSKKEEKQIMQEIVLEMTGENPFHLGLEVYYLDEKYDANLLLLTKWYFIPLMERLTLKDRSQDFSVVAQEFNLTEEEVENAVTLLEATGHLYMSEGRLEKKNVHFQIKAKEKATYIRDFQLMMIEKVLEEIKTKTTDKDCEKRSIEGVTLTIPESKTNEAQQLISTFINDFIGKMEDSSLPEQKIYQLNLQFLPLC